MRKPESTEHGTNRRYNNGCRCDVCCAARSEWKAEQYDRTPRLNAKIREPWANPSLTGPQRWICVECGRPNTFANRCGHTPAWIEAEPERVGLHATRVTRAVGAHR